MRELLRKIFYWVKESYWLKSGSYTLFSRLYRTLIGLFSFIFLVRILPPYLLGEWVLYISIITVIEVIRDGFLINPLVKFVVEKTSGEISKVPSVLTSSFILNFVFSVLALVIIFFVRGFVSDLLNSQIIETLLLIGGVKLLFTFPGSFCNALQQANFEFKWVFWADVVNRTLYISMLLTIFFSGYQIELTQLAILDLIIYFISTCVALFGARSLLKFSRSFDFRLIGQIFRFAKFMLATNVGTMLFRNIDSWMLSSIISPSAVAIYTPAIRIANFVDVPFQSLNTILFPKIVLAYHENGIERVKSYYEKSVSATLSFLLPVNIVLWLFAETVIILIAGDKYLDAIPLLRITLITSFIIPFVKQFGVVMDSIKKPHVNTKFVLFLVLVNVIFNFILIHNLGVKGAAIGTFLGVFSGFIVCSIYLYKNINVSIRYILLQIFSNYAKAWRIFKENIR